MADRFCCPVQNHLVLFPLFQKINPAQLGPGRREEPSFPMPGGSIHPKDAVHFAEHNPVIAENGYPGLIFPKTGHGALAGTRLSDEKVTFTLRIRYPAGMNFYPSTLGQKMNEKEFIQRVFQRINGLAGVKIGGMNEYPCPGKICLDLGCFIWNGANGLRIKIKLIISISFVKPPGAAGVKDFFIAGLYSRQIIPPDFDGDIRISSLGEKIFGCALELEL